MTAPAPERRLSVGGSYNFRDVGGYPLAGGACTAWGRLLRSDAATFDRDPELLALGLRTVIDLRDDAERIAVATGLDALASRVLHRPLDPRPLLPADPDSRTDPLGELYVELVRGRGDRLAGIIRELAEPGSLPALVHCAAGKDRTGVVVALVLSAIGVPDDVVADDYALTANYLTPAFFTGLPQAVDGAVHLSLRAARPESIATMLRTVRHDHGDVRRYLIAHGVPSDRLTDLRTALTADPGVQP